MWANPIYTGIVIVSVPLKGSFILNERGLPCGQQNCWFGFRPLKGVLYFEYVVGEAYKIIDGFPSP